MYLSLDLLVVDIFSRPFAFAATITFVDNAVDKSLMKIHEYLRRRHNHVCESFLSGSTGSSRPLAGFSGLVSGCGQHDQRVRRAWRKPSR